MKLRYILILLLFAPLSGFCQLTMSYTLNAPKIGDSIIYYNLTDTSLREGSFGSNRTWDLSHIKLSGVPIRLIYKNPANTPFASAFPTANVALYDSAGKSFSYFKTDSSKMIKLGVGSNSDTIRYTDPEIEAIYPFSYNSYKNDSFYWQASNVEHFGTILNSADAYGKMILPNRSDSGILRVYTNESVLNVDHRSTVTDTSRTVTETYSYYLPNQEFPVIQVVYLHIGGGNIKTVRYYPASDPTGIEREENKLVDATVFPNPAANNFYLDLDIKAAGKLDVKIYNTLGMKTSTAFTSTIGVGKQRIEINNASLNPGMYFVEVKLNQSSQMLKLIVK